MDLPIPASGPLEQAVLPDVDAILQTALETLKAPAAAQLSREIRP